jgi:hypothetical protein
MAEEKKAEKAVEMQVVKIVGQKYMAEQLAAGPEYIQSYIEGFRLKQHFGIVVNHGSVLWKPNSLLIYCHVSHIPKYVNVKEEIIEADVYTLSQIKNLMGGNNFSEEYIFDRLCNGMLDKGDASVDEVDVPDEINVRSFYINFKSRGYGMRKWIASHYEQPNVLLTCDLAHDDLVGKELMSWVLENIPMTNVFEDVKTPRLTVMLGCDPEFEYVDKNGCVSTSFPPGLITGSDRLRSSVGIDGSGNQVELRPGPAESPKQLIHNVRELFQLVKGHYLSSIGDRYPLGCHIHFGLGGPVNPSTQLAALLTDFLGKACYCLNSQRRTDSGYGNLSNDVVRRQPHGFEYRSLPASVMQSPGLFRIILKISKNLVEHYFNGDVIEYKRKKVQYGCPCEEDYIKWGGITKREFSRFVTAISDLQDTYIKGRLRQNVIAFWVRDVPKNFKKDEVVDPKKKTATASGLTARTILDAAVLMNGPLPLSDEAEEDDWNDDEDDRDHDNDCESLRHSIPVPPSPPSTGPRPGARPRQGRSERPRTNIGFQVGCIRFELHDSWTPSRSTRFIGMFQERTLEVDEIIDEITAGRDVELDEVRRRMNDHVFTVYGLSAERGYCVAGFDFGTVSRVPHPNMAADTLQSVGLPYDCRCDMGSNYEDIFTAAINHLIDNIRVMTIWCIDNILNDQAQRTQDQPGTTVRQTPEDMVSTVLNAGEPLATSPGAILVNASPWVDVSPWARPRPANVTPPPGTGAPPVDPQDPEF